MTTRRALFAIFFALCLSVYSHATITQLRGVTGISAGIDFSCAVTQVGDVYCWGKNDVGQMGVATPAINDGGYHTALNPVRVSGLSGAVSVASGWGHSCAMRSDGSVWCWGSNSAGQAGNSSFLDQVVPVRISGLPTVASIHASGSATCAVTVAGELWCWGDFDYFSGLLVDGRQESERATPARIAGLTQVTTMGLGPNNACAVTSAGQVFCWGDSGDGQIGDNQISSYPRTPQQVRNLSDAVSVAVSGSGVCAVLSSGVLMCWGFIFVVGNSYNGTVSPVPGQVDIGHTVATVDMADGGMCALDSTGMMFCWGAEIPRFGAGDEPWPYQYRPGAISPVLGQRVSALAMGRNHSCVVTADSAVSCWGNSYGSGVGRILYDGSSLPLPVLLSGKYGAIFAWIDSVPEPLGENSVLRLSRQDEIVVGVGFDSNSLRQSEAPLGKVDVLDGSSVVCANLNFTTRDRTLEGPALVGTPTYSTAKCILPASARRVGVFHLTARFSGDSNFSGASAQTNPVDLVEGPARFKRVVEFHHRVLDYYFITSRANEVALLDGLSSQGWQRTGQTFRLYAEQVKSPPNAIYQQRLPIRRFYFDQVARNGSRGSHFYATAQSDVDALHQLNPQNAAVPRLPVDEGDDSFAYSSPSPGYSCGFYGWTLTVFRLFRFTADDPNHRYTADPATVTAMPSSVWRREGVAFCALP